jgi:hypothetical protein
MAAGNFVPVKQVPKMKKGRVFFFEKKNQKLLRMSARLGRRSN